MSGSTQKLATEFKRQGRLNMQAALSAARKNTKAIRDQRIARAREDREKAAQQARQKKEVQAHQRTQTALALKGLNNVLAFFKLRDVQMYLKSFNSVAPLILFSYIPGNLSRSEECQLCVSPESLELEYGAFDAGDTYKTEISLQERLKQLPQLLADEWNTANDSVFIYITTSELCIERSSGLSILFDFFVDCADPEKLYKYLQIALEHRGSSVDDVYHI